MSTVVSRERGGGAQALGLAYTAAHCAGTQDGEFSLSFSPVVVVRPARSRAVTGTAVTEWGESSVSLMSVCAVRCAVHICCGHKSQQSLINHDNMIMNLYCRDD